jgi:excisionase family DNA binding protein
MCGATCFTNEPKAEVDEKRLRKVNHTGNRSNSRNGGKMEVKLITVEDAAKILGIHKSTVYRWCTMRYLPHYRVGTIILINEEELMEFIKSCRVSQETNKISKKKKRILKEER